MWKSLMAKSLQSRIKGDTAECVTYLTSQPTLRATVSICLPARMHCVKRDCISILLIESLV